MTDVISSLICWKIKDVSETYQQNHLQLIQVKCQFPDPALHKEKLLVKCGKMLGSFESFDVFE